jgi:hypothetical protein
MKYAASELARRAVDATDPGLRPTTEVALQLAGHRHDITGLNYLTYIFHGLIPKSVMLVSSARVSEVPIETPRSGSCSVPRPRPMPSPRQPPCSQAASSTGSSRLTLAACKRALPAWLSTSSTRVRPPDPRDSCRYSPLGPQLPDVWSRFTQASRVAVANRSRRSFRPALRVPARPAGQRALRRPLSRFGT